MYQGRENISTDHGTIRRRTLVKGTSWAVPAVAAASAAPAFAASQTVSGSICNLYYANDNSANYRVHTIYLGRRTSTGTIPKDTQFSWTICLSGTGNKRVPQLTSPSGMTITSSPGPGSPLESGECFTVTLTYIEDVTGHTPNVTACQGPSLTWTSGTSYQIAPGTTVKITSNNPTGPVTSGGTGTLEYVVNDANPSGVNQRGRAPHRFLSRAGTQTCYPKIDFAPNSSDGYYDVVCYPEGTAWTSGAARCNWSGTSCTPAPAGMCTPPAETPVGGQTIIPEMC